MNTDYDNDTWKRDINSFQRYKVMLDKTKSPAIRKMIIKSLQDLKDRHPHHMKNEVIPAE